VPHRAFDTGAHRLLSCCASQPTSLYLHVIDYCELHNNRPKLTTFPIVFRAKALQRQETHNDVPEWIWPIAKQQHATAARL
jgi:hypothetical protein